MITIVVLMILATISISSVLGDNGIIKKAKEMKNNTSGFVGNQENSMQELLEEYSNMMSEPGILKGPNGKTLVTELTNIQSQTIEAEDIKGNPVTVPKGFKVMADEGTIVPEGIVIEDEAGNQFVWIPVGEYKTLTGEVLTNNLCRRNFISTGPTELDGDAVIGTYYHGEGYSESCIYGTDYSIDKFKDSANENSGFYIGRYEAGVTKKREAASDTLTPVLSKSGLYPYTYITKTDAIQQCQAMYQNDSVRSTLISSYGWDTALNFLCQNSEYGYKLAIIKRESEYANVSTGTECKTGEYISDCYSNIHDLLGNVYEWTTEYSNDEQFESVFRGDGYNNYGNRYPALRDYSTASLTYPTRGFRVQLYINVDN